MRFLKFAIVLVLCIYTEANQDGAEVVPIGPDGHTTSPKPPAPTPTEPPTSSSVHPPTAHPTSPSTTTTPKPTTPKPTTTTSATTTSTTTTVPSTPKPSPTPKPTPTPKPNPPTPAPTPGKPEVGTWNVTKPGSDVKCILAKMAMQIEVDYEEKNKTKNAILNVPVNATANGECDNDKTSTFTLTWLDKQLNVTSNVSFHFMNNTNSSEISLDHILVNLSGLHAPNETDPMNFFYNQSIFEAPLKHSYKCNKDQSLTLINPTNGSHCKATLKVSQLQIQAFRTTNTTDFGDAINCIRSTPDIVPIAVGCALAALVVIVLLAYLYGRRRSQARGYLSMFAESKQEEDYIPMKTLSCFH